MSSFIVKPNLPEGRVSALICGGLNERLTDFLKGRGIEIFYTVPNKSADRAVAEHADLSVLYLGEGRIIIDRGQPELIEGLRISGFLVSQTEKNVEGLYPDDCILNHAVVGDFIIGKRKIFDTTVARLTNDLEIINVNQGYCKCSVLVVDGNSIITDDESVYVNASKKGIDSLLISKGDVSLDGHEYGFIGGASGKISHNEILFFGDITLHRDYERIRAFLSVRGMEIISLDFPLTDFGGIIPIKENIF